MTIWQLLAVFFVIFIVNIIILVVSGGGTVAEVSLKMATFALVETWIIAAAFWCFEHVRIV